MSLETDIKQIEKIAHLLDSKFKIGPFKFGLDPILGLIPGLGDFIPNLFSSYTIFLAVKHSLPKEVITKMFFNSLIDLLVGSIPIIGDIFDFFFKSNTKNLELLKKHQ